MFSNIINQIVNFVTQQDFLVLLSFFVVTVSSQLVGTLRAIFVANKAGFAAYVAVAVDALLYSFLVSALTKQTTITIILFVIGRLIGTQLANAIESRIGIGIYDIDLYINNHELQKKLQEAFLAAGISSTMNVGTVSGNEVRWSNNIQLKRREMSKFYDILNATGINTPNMVIRPAKKVTGAISDHLTIT